MIFQLAQRLLARPADEDHLRAWCVVLRHHTGGDCAAMSANDDLAEQTAQPFERDTAGRRSTGGVRVRSRIVDSTPTFVGPASSSRSIRPARSASTCSAVVGLVWVKRLALGAAIGTPAARMSARATGWSG